MCSWTALWQCGQLDMAVCSELGLITVSLRREHTDVALCPLRTTAAGLQDSEERGVRTEFHVISISDSFVAYCASSSVASVCVFDVSVSLTFSINMTLHRRSLLSSYFSLYPGWVFVPLLSFLAILSASRPSEISISRCPWNLANSWVFGDGARDLILEIGTCYFRRGKLCFLADVGRAKVFKH